MGDSALGEIGNILGASAVGALAQMTGLALEPQPPHVLYDMLGAVVASVRQRDRRRARPRARARRRAGRRGGGLRALFLLLPTAGGVAELLGRLGLDPVPPGGVSGR